MSSNKISVRLLTKDDLPEMYNAFEVAFRDYPIPFRLSEEHFRKKFVDKLKINFSLSAGAFADRKLKAFIFTSVSRYEGQITAYNGGTGVDPEYRGNGLTYQLYNYLIPRFKQENVTQCILEVLTENEPAINVYENIGFSKSKKFKCYKLNPAAPVTSKENMEIKIIRVESPNWKVYTKFFDYIPSYLDSRAMIEANLTNEVVVEAVLNEVAVGYAIFQPVIGRISHIAVSPDQREKGIGSMLLRQIYKESNSKALTIINVLEEAKTMACFLTRSGFEIELDQYEMRRML